MEISQGLFSETVQKKYRAEILSRSRRHAQGLIIAVFQHSALCEACVHTDKVESSFQETCEPVEAQQDFNKGKETEGLIEYKFETLSPFAPSPVRLVSSRLQYFICIFRWSQKKTN
jgi:hypothetical protein